MTKTSLIAALLLGTSLWAQASEPRCEAVPQDQWQPVSALQAKLQAAGWTVKKTKVDKGCYEVYGTDARGQRVEVYFHPRSLEQVKP